jgi:hypothetical protein
MDSHIFLKQLKEKISEVRYFLLNLYHAKSMVKTRFISIFKVIRHETFTAGSQAEHYLSTDT